MKMFLRLLSLGFLAVVISATGCKKKEESAAPGGDASKPAESKPTTPAVELPLKWQAGKRYSFRQETKDSTDINTTLPQGQPQSMKIEGTDTQEFTLTVTGERPNGAGHEVEFEIHTRKAQQKMAGPTNAQTAAINRALLNFDSSLPRTRDTTPQAKMLRRMVTNKVTFVTDPAGKVESVKDFAAFQKKLTQGISPASQEAVMLKMMFTEDNLKQMDILPVGTPGKPVREGDNWKLQSAVSIAQMASINSDISVSFKGYEEKDGKKFAVLETQGAIVNKALAGTAGPGQPAAPAAPAAPAPGDAADAGRTSPEPGNESMQQQPAAAAPAPSSVPGQIGTITGKMLYDPELGMIVESTQTRQITISTPAVQGRTMSTVLNQTISSKLVEVKDAPGAAAAPAAKKEEPKAAEPKTDAAK